MLPRKWQVPVFLPPVPPASRTTSVAELRSRTIGVWGRCARRPATPVPQQSAESVGRMVSPMVALYTSVSRAWTSVSDRYTFMDSLRDFSKVHTEVLARYVGSCPRFDKKNGGDDLCGHEVCQCQVHTFCGKHCSPACKMPVLPGPSPKTYQVKF